MARQLRLMFLLLLLHKPPPVANDSAFALRASECKTVSGGSASWRLMIWLRPLNLLGYSNGTILQSAKTLEAVAAPTRFSS